jgi:trans-2,3-dihydro-3-hydroxyanthranilate isomerase
MRRAFVTLDVFTHERFAGNPLAVVLAGDALESTAMQAIAREFNLAETVFVLPPATAAHRARLRIFTPATELPFAGHPTVGTAVLLNRIDGGSGARTITVEEGIGPVRCAAEAIDAERGRARFDVPRLPSEAGAAGPVSAIAAALGLATGDIGFDGFVPTRWSAGVPFTFVPLCGLDAMKRARVDPTGWDAGFGQDGHAAAYLFCRQTVAAERAFHARMFAPRMGVHEDPATGSAAAAFAGVVARFDAFSDGDHELGIEQGLEIGRPSLIRLSLSIRERRLVAAGIGGEAIVVSEGMIEA